MKTVAIVGIEKNLKHYIAAVHGLALEPVVTTDPTDAAACDGLLLPGGGDIDPALFHEENQGSTDIDRPLDEAQLEALARFVQAERPVLGICKGHQVINVYFGGTIIQDLATAPAHRHLGEAGDNVHPLIVYSDSPLYDLYGGHIAVNSAHHQGLGAVGTDLRVIAAAPDGTAEAIVHDSLPILGVQFHPERMCFAKGRPDTADGEPLLRHFKSLLER
ncbi:MAG: gamma-glutamyl-gamma-aminobutyrate hydrolase family protein [Oscillospiraceae bacterium]|nr:gamma-glutamyl-gamma-aminobutyrate hydrolase family protein [Oscillospiraceae bacterium]